MKASARFSNVAYLIAWFVLAAASAGCRSGVYTASKLPDQFKADGVVTTQKLDLASLSSQTVRRDVIYPGDVLNVSIATGLADDRWTRWELQVALDGTITIPLVGQVAVTGITVDQAERTVLAAAVERQIYRNPQVSVRLESRRMNEISVLGEVKKPGVVSLPEIGSDVVAAIASAGGLSKDADTIVEIRHPRQSPIQQASFQPGNPSQEDRVVTVDLSQTTKINPADLQLQDGSVVIVQKQVKHSVYVMGKVKKAGEYELPVDRDLRVLDAIALAGGRNVELANKVHVVRSSADKGQPVIIKISMYEAKRNQDANVLLAPGDVVTVEETPLTFAMYTIRSFIRFGFSSRIPGI